MRSQSPERRWGSAPSRRSNSAAFAKQDIQKISNEDARQHKSDLLGFDADRFGLRFSRLPIYAKALDSTVDRGKNLHEQEADRVAAQIMGRLTHTIDDPIEPPIRHLTGKSDGLTDMVPSSVTDAITNPGNPLEPDLRQYMEQRFGYDFSRVRVHSGSVEAQSAWDVNAAAYTMGHHIVFGEGRFTPGTREGTRLIAHELTHVIQQQSALPLDIGPSRVSSSSSGISAMILQREELDPRHLQVEKIATPNLVEITESLIENEGTKKTVIYWVKFEVDSEGLMTASVRTVSADRAFRSRTLRFGDEFRRALGHFQQNGVNVKAFEGDWSWMDENEISENLRVFREGMAEGLTREAAAARTPTGRVAASSGFEVVHVENVAESQEHLAAEGVRRWRVKAIFRRPPLAPVTPPAATASGTIPSGGGARQAATGFEKAESKFAAGERAAGNLARFGRRAGRFAVLLTDLFLPGPLDALELWISFFGSWAEAKAELKEEFFAIGFSEGIAASLLGVPADVATRMLIKVEPMPGGVVGEVTGFGRARQQGTNEGVSAGWKFAGHLTVEQRRGFRNVGFAGIKAKGHAISERFDLSDVIELASALKPVVDDLLEAAREQEEAEQKRKADEENRKFQETRRGGGN
jgi:hypothetical protein